MNSVLAMVVMIVVAMELSEEDPSYYVLCFCAASCGIGGGGFSSSSSSMSFYFPKHRLGFATATNGGLGNLGVSLSQFLLPVVAGMHLFPGTSSCSHLFNFYPQNFAIIYAVLLGIFATVAYFGMNTLPQHGAKNGSDFENFVSWARVTATGYAATYLAVVLFLWSVPYVKADKTLVIGRVIVLSTLVCACAVGFLYVGGGAGVRNKLVSLIPTTKDSNLWWMTYLYIMCFGSFIGFAASFPLLVTQVFGYLPDGSPNPAMAGVAAKYAWLGPFVGSFARIAGGNLSDVLGASAVTHWGTVVQIIAAVVVAQLINLAKAAETPETYFMPFLFFFVVLYGATGSSNGSTFKQMGVLFTGEAKGPVLGWTAGVGAYCSALFPALFAAFDDRALCLYIFTIYYVSCLLVNYWLYYRANARFPC
jgi:NNP family nitrate/nitrite transporter-like MFS transporter